MRQHFLRNTQMLAASTLAAWVLCLLIPLFLLSQAARAASDGLLDTTSTGNTGVSLSLPRLFRIGGIDDITFDAYSGSGGMSKDDDICVWTNTEDGTYRVTAKGDGTDYAFVVKRVGETTRIIPYAVYWNTTAGTSGSQQLTANSISTNKSGANRESSTCAIGPAATANFQVTFTQSDLLAARSGTYTGVLSLVVSPSI